VIVGLTGGIGSGKSTVARLFALMGCAVFNSDEAAKDAYTHEAVRKKVIGLLGSDAYHMNGALDRAYVSDRVFSDTTLLGKLNAIIHPEVGVTFGRFISEHKGEIIVKESALLFEANLTGSCDKIVVVEAPDEVRIRRVMERDGVSRDEVMKRMMSQLPQGAKIARADFVIHNGEREMVIPQVDAISEQLRGLNVN
jgi:dephospho-CoA kinase